MKIGDTTIHLWGVDCLRGMRDLVPSGSIDIAITSPPNVGETDSDGNTGPDLEGYLCWTEEWARALRDNLRVNGSLFLIFQEKSAYPLLPHAVVKRIVGGNNILALQNTVHSIRSIAVPDAASGDHQRGHFKPVASPYRLHDCHGYIFHLSRTGITDVGGICTIQLPDVLAIVYTATEQSLSGAANVAVRAALERQKLPFDRTMATVLPIPNKFDTQTERVIPQKWLNRFEEVVAPFYDSWLPKGVNKREFLQATKLPYSSYYSFGEELPVVEHSGKD